ncbi:MAG: DsbA family protein [Myxococcales bacterium]|nr:DsbA family protein [Myxococcales bacterium]
MSGIGRRLLPPVAAALTSKTMERAVHAVAGAGRAVRGGRRTLTVYHRVDDPYSDLLVQALPRIRDAYDVHLRLRVAGPTDPAELGDPELWPAHARADAAAIAPAYGLRFEARAPRGEDVALAERVLVRHREASEALEVFAQVGRALFTGDRATLEALPAAGEAETARELEDASAERARRGHYLGGTLHHEGELYWGVDRLSLLERRLIAAGARTAAGDAPLFETPSMGEGPHAAATVEVFYSFRSPYAYLGLERAARLFTDRPVTLVPRPIAPMVRRGVTASRAKRVYIVRDVARLARAAGVPFGRACDPLPGFARAAALYAVAADEDRALPFLRAYGRGVWSEGLDVMRDGDLRRLAEEVGLPWAACEASLRSGPPAFLDENAAALHDHGLWGVPTFVLDGRALWGQDRLWLLDQRIRDRVA